MSDFIPLPQSPFLVESSIRVPDLTVGWLDYQPEVTQVKTRRCHIRELTHNQARETMMLLIYCDHVGLARRYLDHHPQLNPNDHYHHQYFLTWAIVCNAANCITLFLDLGVNVNIQDNLGWFQGWPAITLAAKDGFFNLVERLWDKGALISASNPRYQTALHFLASNPEECHLDFWRRAVRVAPDVIGHRFALRLLLPGQMTCPSVMDLLLLNRGHPPVESFIRVLFEEHFHWPVLVPGDEDAMLLEPEVVHRYLASLDFRTLKATLRHVRTRMSLQAYVEWLNRSPFPWDHPLCGCFWRGMARRWDCLVHLIYEGCRIEMSAQTHDQPLLQVALQDTDINLGQIKFLLQHGAYAPAVNTGYRSIFRLALERGEAFAWEVFRFGAKPYNEEMDVPEVMKMNRSMKDLRFLASVKFASILKEGVTLVGALECMNLTGLKSPIFDMNC